VFLDRLQSGFLLFETQQGLVRFELSLQQRIYLLWTFRNFRQLSIPLLNSRQRALVNSLFQNNAGVVSDAQDPKLVIGVVENFVRPPVSIDMRIDASPAQKPAPKKQSQEVVAQRAEIALKPNPVPSYSPKAAWSALATTVAALSLCIVSVAAWHRIQGIPASEAHNQPRIQQIDAIAPPNSPHSAEPATIAERPIAEGPIAIAEPAVTAEPVAAPEAAPEVAVKPTPIAAVVPTPLSAPIPTPVESPIPTPKQAIRVHDVAASTSRLQLSGQDSRIQASRPPLHFVYPNYPDVHARGVVSLTAVLDSEGAVRSVRVVSGNRALATAAIRAVRQWHYRPYLKDGQPVATETNIVISFISEDAISMSFPPSIAPIR
jgi:protein TonB